MGTTPPGYGGDPYLPSWSREKKIFWNILSRILQSILLCIINSARNGVERAILRIKSTTCLQTNPILHADFFTFPGPGL